MKNAPEQEKKKYKPDIRNEFKYRGYKIREVFNKKTKRLEFRARFQINNTEINLVEDKRKNLEEMIDEYVYQERRSKYNLPTTVRTVSVSELFSGHLNRLKKSGSRKKITIFERVSKKLLELLPADIKISQLKKAHFQKYIEARGSEKNPQSGETILPETINKELSAVSVAFRNAALYFSELDGAGLPEIPKAKTTKGGRRRERLVGKTDELAVLLEYLRRPHRNPKTQAARRAVADDLEIRYETGLRRVEVARLTRGQYHRGEAALRDVKRWKTGTVTKFFPLTRRAVEIIEARLADNKESNYIFTAAGKPNEGAYRMLKNICAKENLNLNYGTHKAGGFVPHDLRHNFATEIIRVTDLETAKSLTGHTGQHIMTYLHTDEHRQREAMTRREGSPDLKEKLAALYNEVKVGKIDVDGFIKSVEFLIKNG